MKVVYSRGKTKRSKGSRIYTPSIQTGVTGLSESYTKIKLIWSTELHDRQVLTHSYTVQGHNANVPEMKRKYGGKQN
jgi:hypothetical protein